MRKLILAILVLALNSWPAVAQNASGTGSSPTTQSAPANPTVPPSLTPDPRLTGSAPVGHRQPTAGTAPASESKDLYSESAEDKALNRKIRSICKGC